MKKVFDFPRALWKIVTNPPFMSLCLAAATEWFIMVGVAVFAPKFFEAQLNMTSSEVASIIGEYSVFPPVPMVRPSKYTLPARENCPLIFLLQKWHQKTI